MKQKLILTAFIFVLLTAARAAETEPNNDRASANTLALNGNNTGKIDPAGDQDWWKVTTNADGKLDITLTPMSGRSMWIYLYDNNGTTSLGSSSSSSGFTLSTDGLAAGTYYIKIVCYFGTDTSSYQISDVLTSAVPANDAEPNDTKAQAITLGLNNSTTGHVGYYYNIHRDTSDWYKLTTNGDGRVRLSITPANSKAVWAYLYDNDGTTLLASGNSGSAFTVTKDGLAAGTYYIKIICYFPNTDYAPYSLADSLFTPTQLNDKEANNTKASADTLLQNGSTTGHVGYYYNKQRDTSDWYKITTNADGRLRVSLAPANGLIVWAFLYDNDGSTQLTSGNSGSAFSITKDGLAAGTYYVKIISYFPNTDYAPYTLSDSLFTPAEANDKEPNDTKANGITLAVNKSTTGHAGYYYNLRRDTTDWYKIVTKTDGLLRLSLVPGNGNIVWVYLYDNNGVTLLNSANSSSAFNFSTDGLAAGTYYVAVKCYFASDFAPYTLADSLFTYSNTADAESDDKPYLGKTLPANGTGPGHVGFYYNNKRDTADWWKINYTGSGSLKVTANLEPRKLLGTNAATYMEIWKDTLAAPIFSNNTSGSSLVANLNSLTQGYYWIRVRCYFASEFQSYSLVDSFTQVNIASVKATSYDTAASCSLINTISFSCSGSSAPYSVKLYRYNVLYATKTARMKNVTFDSLPIGSYYAKAWGDGATGNASGKSKTVNVVPIPTTLPPTGVSTTQATLNWTPVSCAKFDSIYYRVHGTTAWTKRNTSGNPSSYLLTGLTASTTYDWEIAAVDSANGIIATGPFSPIAMFVTTTTPLANNGQNINDAATAGSIRNVVDVLPNPATSYFLINYKAPTAEKVSAVLVDVHGKTVWSSGSVQAISLDGRRVSTDQFANGIFYFKIINESGKLMGTAKVVVAR